MAEDPVGAVERLVKSKQRVADHGEVFTPLSIVNAMLDLVKDESERIDSRFLEPACGEGNFLKVVLARKLATVQARYGANEFERRHYGLLALMSIYGIELLEDNAQKCRQNLVDIFAEFIDSEGDEEWIGAATCVVAANIVQADATTMERPNKEPIIFPEWGYLGKGKFNRRDFKFSNLTQRAALGDVSQHSFFDGTIFDEADSSHLFEPNYQYPTATVKELAKLKGAM